MELHEALTDGKSRMEELTGDLEEKESELRRQVDHAERQSEAFELERYRSVESVTKSWEEREQRLLDQLADARRDL